MFSLPTDKQRIEQAKIDVRLHFPRRHRDPGWRVLARQSIGKLRELKAHPGSLLPDPPAKCDPDKRGGEPVRIGRILEEMELSK